MVMVPVPPMGVLPQMLQASPVKPDPIKRIHCARNLFGANRSDNEEISKLLAQEHRENIERINSRYTLVLNPKEQQQETNIKMLAKCNQQGKFVGADISRINLICRDSPYNIKSYTPPGIKATYKVTKMRTSNVPKRKNNNNIINNNTNNKNNNDSSSNNNNNNNTANLLSGNSTIMDKQEESGNINNDNNGNK